MTVSMSVVYPLNDEEINKRVEREKLGVYFLHGNVTMPDTKYRVGRSDNDLKGRLKTYVSSKYKYFQFAYAETLKECFEKECELYHEYGGPKEEGGLLDNTNHPDRPNGFDWQCPKCDHFKK